MKPIKNSCSGNGVCTVDTYATLDCIVMPGYSRTKPLASYHFNLYYIVLACGYVHNVSCVCITASYTLIVDCTVLNRYGPLCAVL